jgi:hypothetical protein
MFSKFRDFFADTRTAAENVTGQSEEGRRIREEYYHVAYPEDVRDHKEVRLFRDTFKEFSPLIHPEAEDDYETEEPAAWENVEEKDSKYGKVPENDKTTPLTRDEDLKRKPVAK